MDLHPAVLRSHRSPRAHHRINVVSLPFRLSVLDQAPIPEGQTAGDALRNTLELARLADTAGYHRYWLAEHHGSPSLACCSPEVMIGPVCCVTSRIRVGTGGVMLPHYSPLKVAETFSMLSGLYPGRIDLGLGRAAGTSARIAHALQRDRRQPPPDDFPEQLTELLGYFASDRFASPEVSLLGSSSDSAQWAGELGLPYVFADFINPFHAENAQLYRECFVPSPRMAKPRVSVAVWAVCAESHDEAVMLSMSVRMMMTLLYRGRPIAVPTPERALEFLREEGVPPELLPAGRRILAGTPAEVRDQLVAIAEDYTAEELFVVNILHDHRARLRSYELLAG